MKAKNLPISVVAAALCGLAGAVSGMTPMGTAFTYQGNLEKENVLVTDTCTFDLSLWDGSSCEAPAGQIGGTQSFPGESVEDGLFTLVVDFGAAAFTGEARWLAITVQCSVDATPVTLSPCLELTPAPYAAYAPKTLDQAYDQGGPGAGGAIVADAGPVTISGPSGFQVFGPLWSSNSTSPHPGIKVSRADSGPPFSSLRTEIDANTINAYGYMFNEGSRDLRLNNDSGGDVLLAEGGGRVGIGTDNPTNQLTVAGTVLSTSGGFKFPDGSIQTSAASGGAGRSPMQIALLKWYDANQSGVVTYTYAGPRGLAFDGAHIWVTHSGHDTVQQHVASDGGYGGRYDVGDSPSGVAFDGKYIWVTNSGSNSVSKLRAADGLTVGTYAVGLNPENVAFDGANIWVTNADVDTVSKLRASDGAIQGTYAVGDRPFGVAFDGANIWVTNGLDDTVTKLRAGDGATLGTYAVGNYPFCVAFDGANIWVANENDDTVTKLRAIDGATLGTYAVGNGPRAIAFDGANIWVANFYDNTLSKL